jgi:hypothetical protein
MAIVMIGGVTGLGGKITDHFSASWACQPITLLSKYDGYDINNVPSILEEVNKVAYGERIFHQPMQDLIVLNAFDHAHPEAQQNLFDALWEQYKNSDVTFIIMGSTAKMWGWNAASDIAKSYSKAKKKLYESVFYKVWEDTTKAKAILIEPSFVENVVNYFEDKGQLYLSHEELLSIIDAGLSLSKFMKLVVISGKGLHPASDFK